MCQNKSFFDKISHISSEEDSKEDTPMNQFDKKNLVPEDVTSFSFKSIYQNINSFTNMKYSKNIIFQEKTLSFLNNLINKDSSNKKGNSSFLSDIHSNIHKILNNESKIIKKDTLSLSGSNSTFRNYGELLNIKNKNFFHNSTEKSGLKSAGFENYHNNNEFQSQNKNIKKKKKQNNKLNINIKENNINNKKNNKLKDKEQCIKLKMFIKKKEKRKVILLLT